MSTKDPLDALRAAISAKYEIVPVNASGSPAGSLRAATHLRLSTATTLPKNAPTRLRKAGSSMTDPSSQPDGFFMLEAVYLAWLLRDTPGGEYMKQAREHGLPAGGFVSLTERKSIVDWLKRAITLLDSIVPLSESTTPPGSPPPSVYRRLPPPSSSTHTQPLPSTSTRSRGDVGTTTSPSKRRYVPDPADMEVVKKIRQGEIELRDHNTVLRGIKNNNFSSVRSAFVAKLKTLKGAGKTGTAVPGAAPLSDPKAQARKQKNMYPIIMISSSPTSLITMYNVRRFFQEWLYRFEPSTEARARAATEGTARAEDLVIIDRERTTIEPGGQARATAQRYYVVDSVEALNKFGADAWDRVVCVLTTGQLWQFRPYKWCEPRILFHHVKGIYVSWANDPPNPKIKDWNVTELKIDPHRRHVDKSSVAYFWKTLDTWTALHKPSLMNT
ncbi:RNA polymerase II accessory factor [Multifurca ochricompacta]|uniref:RNA polymerase II accessory factor n=1 Tax=Multifurca ochricompacta TaxID=376703 RepID=A0AAD4M089_9AGAM|nr:RNA polymerase II accessory factor [Multifurca ochricompacta]